MGRFVRLVALSSFWLFTGSVAVGEVKITVLAGAGGHVRPFAMTPVQVLLDNDDTDREGRVAVAFSGMGRPLTWAVRTLPLPPGARKSVFLYLRVPAFPSEVVVCYETPAGRKVAELRERVLPLPANDPVLAVVGVAPASLPDEKAGEETLYTRLLFRPDQLSDRWEGLEMCDAVLIAPLPFEPFSMDQTLALRDWVLRGGSLAVDVSQRTQALTQNAFVEMLPFFPLSTEQAPLTVFGGEPAQFTTGKMRGGEVLLESEGRPLAVRWNYGLGTVTCFAFDPSFPGFNRWADREQLWIKAMEGLRLEMRKQPAVRVEESDRFDLREEASSALERLVFQAPPTRVRLGVVLLLTALYALVVGPGDYLLIKRLRRPNATWVTFPAIVAAFTFGSYLGARAWIGGETHAANIRRTLVLPDRHLALKLDVAGLFVSAGKDYQIRHADGAFLRPLSESADESDRLTLDGDDNSLVQRIPIWTNRVYVSSRTTSDFPDIGVTIEERDGKRVATITNRCSLTLTNILVVYGDSLWANPTPDLELKPGESASFSLDAGVHGMLSQTAGLANLLYGFSRLEGPAPTWLRELNLRPAVERGALLLMCRDAAKIPCPLVVDDAPRGESGDHLVLVLTFPEPILSAKSQETEP